jgi:membrane associated rhomboid family serine protease
MADGERTSSTGGGDFGGIPGLEDAPLPTCYRHPDRETGVSCSNCGRPICPDCMTPAPVGFRCPVCMGEQRQGAGRARVITRQQTRSRWQSGFAGSGGLSVTKVLIAINAVALVADMLNGSLGLRGSLVPVYVAENGEYWRLLTSMFLHAGMFHLLMNMWALWVIGEYLESAIGRLRFVIVYFASGLAGSALVLIASPPLVATVGASGAVFGLFGALFVYSYFNRARDPMAQVLLRNMAFLIVINLVFTFAFPGISWQGHIGGLLGGAAAMAGFTLFGRRDPRGRFDAVDVITVVVLALVIAALIAWRVANFPPPPYF